MGDTMPASRKKGLLNHLKERKSDSAKEPLSVWEVLGEEYWRSAEPDRDPEESADPEYREKIAVYRDKRSQWHAGGRRDDATLLEYEAAELAFRRVLIRRLHSRRRSALCFSGG